MINIALYQPDIPQNVGAAIRLCACLGMNLHIIEPCGFPWDERKIKQSAMDYFDHLTLKKYPSWQEFKNQHDGRLILMTTKASVPYVDFQFQDGDILIAGRESAGVPDHIHNEVHHRVVIPMFGKARSVNIINATAMIAGEGLRQTGFGS